MPTQQLLITPQEVIDLSFIGEENIKIDRVPETVIIAAQEAYLSPVFGALYDSFLDGNYTEYIQEYIKPPLAYYVRYLILPGVSIQLSNMGAFVPENDFSKGATDRQRDTLRQSALMIAQPLIERALKYVQENLEDFPDFQKKRRKNNIIGGVIF